MVGLVPTQHRGERDDHIGSLRILIDPSAGSVCYFLPLQYRCGEQLQTHALVWWG